MEEAQKEIEIFNKERDWDYNYPKTKRNTMSMKQKADHAK